MQNIKRPLPFVLISSNHGALIVNRNDYRMVDVQRGYGVGFQLLQTGSFDMDEIQFALRLLQKRKTYFGSGVVAIDCGANIGVHTVEWARQMHDWGHVYSFEAQEKIFYALAGNIVINNCLNVTARHCAVGASCGRLNIPEPNYLVPSSYGSFELQQKNTNEFIGQAIDYTKTKEIPLISLDSLALTRLDLIKIDVEGMEWDVLQGALHALEQLKPIVIFEHIKSDKAQLMALFEAKQYECFVVGINVVAVHREDPTRKDLSLHEGRLSLR